MILSTISSTKKWLILFAFLPVVQSCTTTRLVTKYDCNTVAGNPVNKKTTWAFAWGLVQPKDINPHCEKDANYMNQVVIKNNFGFMLLSVATLGIVMPQRVTWCCAPQNIPIDTLGN